MASYYYIGSIQIPNENIIDFSFDNKMTEDNNFIEAGMFLSSASISFYDFRDSSNTYVFMQRISKGDVYTNNDFFSLVVRDVDTAAKKIVMCCFDWSYNYERKVVKISLYDYTYNWKNIKITDIAYPYLESNDKDATYKNIQSNKSYSSSYVEPISASAVNMFKRLVDMTYKVFDIAKISSNFDVKYIEDLPQTIINYMQCISESYSDTFIASESLFDLWDNFCKSIQCCMYVDSLGKIRFLHSADKKLGDAKQIDDSKIVSMDIDISSSTILTNVSGNFASSEAVSINGTSKFANIAEVTQTDGTAINENAIKSSLSALVPSFIEDAVILGLIGDADSFVSNFGLPSSYSRYFMLCWGKIKLSTPYIDFKTLKYNIYVDYSIDLFKTYSSSDKLGTFDYKRDVTLASEQLTIGDSEEKIYAPYFVIGEAPSSSFYSLIARSISNSTNFAYAPFAKSDNSKTSASSDGSDLENVKEASFVFDRYFDKTNSNGSITMNSELFTLAQGSPILYKPPYKYVYSSSYQEWSPQTSDTKYNCLVGGLIFCKSSMSDSDTGKYEYAGNVSIRTTDDIIKYVKRSENILPKKISDTEYEYEVLYFAPTHFTDIYPISSDTNVILPIVSNYRTELKTTNGTTYACSSENKNPMLYIDIKFNDRSSTTERLLFDEADTKISNYVLNNSVSLNNKPSIFSQDADLSILQKTVYYWNCDGNMCVKLKSGANYTVGDTIKFKELSNFFRITSKEQSLSNIYTYDLVEIFKRDLDFNQDHTYFKIEITESDMTNGNNTAVYKASFSADVSSVNFYIDWGDGSSSINYDNSVNLSHTYKAAGEYVITIYTSDIYKLIVEDGNYLGDSIKNIEAHNISRDSVSGMTGGSFATADDVSVDCYFYDYEGNRIYGNIPVYDSNSIDVKYQAIPTTVRQSKIFYDKDRNEFFGSVLDYKGE